MNDISDLYNVIKNFLPLADKYLSGSPLEPYLPEIQNIINLIDSIGGISTINNVIQSFAPKNNNNQTKQNNQQNNKQIVISQQALQHSKSIGSYKRVE